MSEALAGFNSGLWTDGVWSPLGPLGEGMNLNHWVDAAWADGAWVPESWGDGNGGEIALPQAVEEPQASNWQSPYIHKKRLSKDELDALIREQRIALGILPPDLPGQAIAEPEDIAEEVTAAVQNVVKMADIKIDRKSIYKAAYLEAAYAIEEYKAFTVARKRKRMAAFLLLH